MSPVVLVIFIASWLIIGLVTGLWMIRRGHDPFWVMIAVIAGPLFVAPALERVERRPRLAAQGPEAIPEAGSTGSIRPRVLVGLDGSPASERALTTALELFGSGLVVLAEVVNYDATDDASHRALDAAGERLAVAAARARDAGVSVRFEVLAGPPGEALWRFAEEQEMDVIVLGRRGRGLTARLLGGVTSDVVAHATIPVLVVEPGQAPDAPGSRSR
ncbi:universal stress protein [Myceligenerans xiligouense]|uniref:Nucleotide-binding universal stress UspA family protein n=1 Tax=Myceligenerans xiligouense TaxID=253184 RepID=A0A3N4Z7R0_9MICO|nr:universal stress protein [Myceligenerans xiligouense]RPF21888.1 nucleotide-binding universal stress UspA family protein [Myceligenerans xiligouense]